MSAMDGESLTENETGNEKGWMLCFRIKLDHRVWVGFEVERQHRRDVELTNQTPHPTRLIV